MMSALRYRLLSVAARLGIVAAVTILALEAALQIGFPHLPQDLIQPMPQYKERIGMRLTTPHGLREYPAGKREDFTVDGALGDLYKLTCLSPASAPPFDQYQVDYTRDSHGFRNHEPWPNDVDLAIIGDSYTAAEAVSHPFWQGISPSMLVFGLPGSGTVEHQRLYQHFAQPRNPETVVLAFFSGNDLNDSRVFAQYEREGRTFAARVHEGRTPLDYSVLAQMLRTLGAGRENANPDSCHYPQTAATEPPTPVAFYQAFLPTLAQDAETIMASEGYQLARASIEAMTLAQQSRGSAFVLLYIPHKAELYWSYLDAQSKAEIIAGVERDRRYSGLQAIDKNLRAQRDVMRATAQELGIGFLDLTPTLLQAIEAGQTPWFFADTHWNQTGHNIARYALLDFLNQSNLED